MVAYHPCHVPEAPCPRPRAATAHSHRQGGGRQHGRHHRRVVRLLPLRRGRRAGLPHGVLPGRRPGGRHPAGARHVRDRLHRPPDRRAGLRPLRRQDRPQEAAGDQPADDGRGDVRDRPAAGLRDDRAGRAAAAGAAAADPGLRARRRVGRRGADRLRARRPGPARLLGQLAAGRRAGRQLLANGLLALLALVQPEEAFLAWGWRIPFLLSAVLVGIGLYIRLSVEESPVFRAAQAGGRAAGRGRREGGHADPRRVPPLPARGVHRDGRAVRRERLLLHLHHRRGHLPDQERRCTRCPARSCSTRC